MKDKVDAIFKDYYAKKLQAKIDMRTADLKTRHLSDDNLGGFRPQNSYVNPVELNMIVIENDRMINIWRAQIKAIESFLKTLDYENQRMLAWHYASVPKKKSWQQISKLMHLDQSSCKRRFYKIKKEFEKSLFNPVDNS